MTKEEIARMLADQDSQALEFWTYPDHQWQDQFQSHWIWTNVSPEAADAWEA